MNFSSDELLDISIRAGNPKAYRKTNYKTEGANSASAKHQYKETDLLQDEILIQEISAGVLNKKK